MTTRRSTLADETLQAAFLRALRQRVAADPSGKVLLPVGSVSTVELERVLDALARAAEAGR